MLDEILTTIVFILAVAFVLSLGEAEAVSALAVLP